MNKKENKKGSIVPKVITIAIVLFFMMYLIGSNFILKEEKNELEEFILFETEALDYCIGKTNYSSSEEFLADYLRNITEELILEDFIE